MWCEPPAPPAQTGCCQQIPQILHPTANALLISGCISRGAEMSSLSQAWLLTWHGDLSKVGGAGSVDRPPPHHTPTASQPKAARPAALNSDWELIPCPGKGECPRGRTAATPLGVCQVLISFHDYTDAAGVGSQPGKDRARSQRWCGNGTDARMPEAAASLGTAQQGRGCKALVPRGGSPRAAGCHDRPEGSAART